MPSVKVRMLAFGRPGEVREVDLDVIPDDLGQALDAVYHFGQNDVQPKRHPSVSVGDVIELRDDLFMVCGVGFRRLTQLEYATYEALDRLDRELLRYKEANV